MRIEIPTENAKDLRDQARIGESDKVAIRQFVLGMKKPGIYIERGQLKRMAASLAKKLWTARDTKTKSDFFWSRSQMKFFYPNGNAISPDALKGAAHAATVESKIRIQEISSRLEQNIITVPEWYQEMKVATKVLHASEHALANGGITQVKDWSRAEETIHQQWVGRKASKKKKAFPGLRAFASDVASGRYGTPGENLRQAVLTRASMYADAGNASYENERIAVHMDEGFREACRIKGDVDSCPTCIAEDGIWRPADEVVEIGDSECGSRCHCTIIFRRAS